MLKVLFILVFSCHLCTAAPPSPREGFDWKEVSLLAIQNAGRLKPLDTFASESVLFITGKKTFEELSAIEILFSWILEFETAWKDRKFIKINYRPLKKKIGLPTDEKIFSPQELEINPAFQLLVQVAVEKGRSKERLSQVEFHATRLQNRLILLNTIATGKLMAIFPNLKDKNEKWHSLASLIQPGEMTLDYDPELVKKLSLLVHEMTEAFSNRDAPRWNSATEKLATIIKNELGKEVYPSESSLKREWHYNHLRPFRLAWMLYVVALIFLLIFGMKETKTAKITGLAFLVIGFLVHSYGFGLRCWIGGRPPVTNMYESVVWVSWGCALLGFLIWVIYKNTILPIAALILAVLGLVLADNLPSVLDTSIQPLAPVLRSTFWLTTHVLTITLSYAAYALSWGLGNIALGIYLLRPQDAQSRERLSFYMYRTVQIGTLLLAAGTILGGIWADYSWGRFWGWDPKEVWALIALLLYVAVLHGRLTGWLNDFGFVASTVLCFLGILMAWYGVNFVLGAGLHSYGFGSGGFGYISAYTLLQVGFILAAYVRYSTQKPSRA